MATSSRGASNSPGVARRSLSSNRAEPIPLVRTSEDLLFRSASDRIGPATEASGQVRALSVAEANGV